MLSFLKLVSSFVIPPGLFVLIIVLLSLCMLRASRRWAIVWLSVGLLFYMSSIPLIADSLVRFVEQQYEPPNEVKGDVIVLLTSGVTADTPAVWGTGMPVDETAGRIMTAAALHFKYDLPIIIAGGQVYHGAGNEANITKQSLLSIGVRESVIILENMSMTTAENAKNVKDILAAQQFTTPILVTSAIHMPRSVENFEQNGVNVTPFPTAYLANIGVTLNAGQFTPTDHALAKTGHAFKEVLGLLAAKLFDY